ncbi:hypothetical protein HY417_03690 [Candidatus Kaiserbacteria bacterium]|nr:hypothetical protein [Candidatus Kaiserbacteria bacterium]
MSLFERLLPRKKSEAQRTGIEHIHQVRLSSALDVVESELNKTSDGRIRTPFETAVAKGSMSIDYLKRWGSQKIELPAAHDEDGTLVLSTGSPKNTSYDAFNEPLGIITRKDKDKKALLKGRSEAFTRLFVRSRLIPQPYFVHNHPPQPTPEGTMEEIPQPSWSDLFISASSASECDIILTPSCATLYKNRKEKLIAEDAYKKMTRAERDAFLKRNRVLIARVFFTDARAQHVLDFMNGKMKWKDARSMIEEW